MNWDHEGSRQEVAVVQGEVHELDLRGGSGLELCAVVVGGVGLYNSG